MNTNIISGLINYLAAMFSLLFVNIRVHSWLKFFPGPAKGHKPQNPLVPVIFKDHQPTGRLAKVPASRERRLNSIVADATRKKITRRRGLKPTAKFRRCDAAGKTIPAVRMALGDDNISCHGLSQRRRLECFPVRFAEKFTVQRSDGALDARAVDDEADVDRRSAVRNHRDVDLLDARKDSRRDARSELQILSDQADQGRVAFDRDLT